MNKLGFRTVITVLLIILSGYFLFPTFEWYRMSDDEKAKAEKTKDPILGKTLNLGLDLRGGTHLLLEVDSSKLDEKVTIKDAVDRAVEVIRNRIDQFGVAEPLIAKQGDRWIVVQLPGIKDPQRAKELIGKTALLEFCLVSTDNDALNKIQEKMTEKDLANAEEASKDSDIIKLIPEGYFIADSKEDGRIYLLKKASLTGAYLVNAKVELATGGFGFPHVSLEFNKDGGKIFANITGANIDRNLAIVLDGIVQSAPVIRSRIPDGRAVIEGNFNSADAKLLATVLRAGALPAPVNIIE